MVNALSSPFPLTAGRMRRPQREVTTAKGKEAERVRVRKFSKGCKHRVSRALSVRPSATSENGQTERRKKKVVIIGGEWI